MMQIPTIRIVIVSLVLASFCTAEASPDDADSARAIGHVQRGHLLLDRGNYKRAKREFYKATSGPEAAAAYNGLGLSILLDEHSHAPIQKALKYFRQSLGADAGFTEARMNIARVHLKLGNADAAACLLDVIKHDPDYAMAYLELGKLRVKRGDPEEGARQYRRYLDRAPDDSEGRYLLALAYVLSGEDSLAAEQAQSVLEAHPDECRMMPIAANWDGRCGKAEKGLGCFRKYIQSIPPDLKVLYEDISLVAYPEELRAFRKVPKTERAAFLDRFWRKRSLISNSWARDRQLEHYRRVWYARAFFSEVVQPWDRRGEIYIRYGEPDYRSRSGVTNEVPGPEVEAIKERNVSLLYKGEWMEYLPIPSDIASLGAIVGPVYPVNRFTEMTAWTAISERKQEDWAERERRPPRPGLNTRQGVREDEQAGEVRVPWESWVYTQLGGGTEFVFTDQVLNGRWDFAPARTLTAHKPGPWLPRPPHAVDHGTPRTQPGRGVVLCLAAHPRTSLDAESPKSTGLLLRFRLLPGVGA